MFRITATTQVNSTVEVVEVDTAILAIRAHLALAQKGTYKSIVTVDHSGLEPEVWENAVYTIGEQTQCKLNARIKNETKVVRKIVERAIRLGYIVSVYDGEEYCVKRSTDKALIMASVYSTDMDRLHFRNATTGEMIGSVLLVYGNSASEVMADHTDVAMVDDILADAKTFCDKLASEGL